jgi:hypothetical protein
MTTDACRLMRPGAEIAAARILGAKLIAEPQNVVRVSTLNPEPLWRFVFRRPCSTPARPPAQAAKGCGAADGMEIKEVQTQSCSGITLALWFHGNERRN